MLNTKNPIFASYQRDPGLFDEVFDTEGEAREVYRKLFELYGTHSIEDYVHLNNNYLSGLRRP